MANSYGEIRIFKSDEYSLGHYSDEELKENLKISILRDKQELSRIRGLSNNGNKRFAMFSFKKIFGAIFDIELAEAGKIDEKDNFVRFLQVRTRRQGDYISPLGMKGSKKLQDLFTDEKVYKEQRDNVPLVCIGSEVLWVIGDDVSGKTTGMKHGRINEKYKVDPDSDEVLLLEYCAVKKKE